jgi:hypothetical protein
MVAQWLSKKHFQKTKISFSENTIRTSVIER